MYLSIILLSFACSQKGPPPPLSAPAQATMVHVPAREGAADPPPSASPGEGTMRASLLATQARAGRCYGDALAREPHMHGEVVVRVEAGSSGGVARATAAMSTIADRRLLACVEAAAMSARWRADRVEEGTVLHHPYLFTSHLTPPEVVRALRIQHGLADPRSAEGTMELPDNQEPEPGTVETW